MRIPFLLVALLSLESPSHGQTPTDVPSIAVVHTWGDLIGTKPISFEQVPEGAVLTQKAQPGQAPAGEPPFRVWVGIDRDHTAGNNAVLLYCLTKGIDLPPRDNEDKLGPFRVEVKNLGQTQAAMVARQAQTVISNLKSPPAPAYSLYTKAVPLAGPGDYVIELGDNIPPKADGPKRIYARIKIHVGDDPRAHSWSPWEESTEGPDIVSGVSMTVCNPLGGIAVPKASHDGEGIPLADLPPDKTPLPSLLPEKPAPDMQLTMEANAFRIKVQGEIEDEPYENFLTRWWVNGKPWLPDPSKTEVAGRVREGVSALGEKTLPEVRVRFDLDFNPGRLGVKKGDRIGLQFLFCPKGWQWTGEAPIQLELVSRVSPHVSSKPPLDFSSLSNRIDFTYSGDPLHPQQTPPK